MLGYELDSDFYGTGDFVEYVQKGLNNLTLEKVNAVINKHLQEDNMHFVFITSDAKDMKSRLVNETTSAMKYNSEKPEELLNQDKMIQDFPLKLNSDKIEIIAIDEVFK